ncbi:MAG: hypothetical protein E7259_10340 [Lachnospiraceae bacterium]|nr:hypothetical protein [Lachnospiraceae bacterium]
MYTYEKKVLFSDINASSRMSVWSILNSMQDCVNINSESIGRGIDYMLEKKRTWFAISWNIEIKKFPKMFDDITVKTWPYDFSSTMGFRNVIITDSDGNDILCADSIWTLMDMNTGKPTRIEDEDCKGYDLEEKYPMEPMGRKIKLPAEFELMDTVKVRKADIDYNGHMSNGQYIQIADEYMPMDADIERIRVEYKSQAKYKEELDIYMSVEDKRYVIKIVGKEDGSIKAVVEFTVR